LLCFLRHFFNFKFLPFHWDFNFCYMFNIQDLSLNALFVSILFLFQECSINSTHRLLPFTHFL
jgi:hypothetical protein